MFIPAPAPTAYDLRFRLGDIPVRVHPMFWVACIFLGIGPSQGRVEEVLIWLLAVFVSILVHEMGHALTSRAFGARPQITLYAFGGLASYADRGMTRAQRIAISLAGPAAGFALAAVIVGLVYAFGGRVAVHDWMLVPLLDPDKRLLLVLVFYLFYINTWWGLINLLPILPLDGGHVAQELMVAHRERGLYESYVVSVAVAGALALYGALYLRDWFLTLFFLALAVNSYQFLQQLRGYSTNGHDGWR